MKKFRFYHWCLIAILMCSALMYNFPTQNEYLLCGKVAKIDKEYYGKHTNTKNVLYLLKEDNTVEKLDVDDTTYILKKVGDSVCFEQSDPTGLGKTCIIIITLALMLGFFSFFTELK